ncbi:MULTISPECIES: BREX-2 system phosphatase PglZ [Streptomyces]|uniref:BREX-2 system phosphatase PglZ n=1 Tax=Streptomyces TaxID=1883 RepID=UPI0022499F94|nr:BREX-2 system phosphatase PglZ [Streptomyces sp. JHD 1]MCX2968588.1 BREX-2 system phosphatase PglZ [Streptomyces sp. JHD 1]
MTHSTAAGVAVQLNLATITQYLTSQSALASSLTGGDRRRVVLLRSAPRWDGPARPTWGEGRTARITAAPSPLAVHELVLDHLAERAAGPDVLVVLTDREQNELDPAILARAHKRRVEVVDSWDVVRDAFGAKHVDPRLKEANWAGEALLDAAPPGGWPPVAGGTLSRQVALSALALRRLRVGRYAERSGEPTDAARRAGRGSAYDPVDPHTLLSWSLTAGGPQRLLALRAPERAGLAAFLGEEEQAGPAGRALLAVVEAEHGPEAVAFGLLCAALWCHAAPDAATYTARGRAGQWFGERDGKRLTDDEVAELASALGRAAEEYVGALLARAARGADDAAGGPASGADDAREARRLSDIVLDQAARLARQLGAEAATAASPLLPAGLDARFAAVGHALAAGRPAPLAEAMRALAAHRRAGGEQARVRIERARMAQRLTRWLAGEPGSECVTVADALERHVRETGWVDRALEHIEAGGDPEPALRSAYDALAARVRARRQEIDRDFARRLATWTAAGTPPGSMLTVETFLDRVVRPVVRSAPKRRVLLLVLDGMSAAIAGELGEELRSSWAEYDPVDDGPPRRRAMAAALPTLTAVSRTSLFAGALTRGAQADEKRLFPSLPLWDGAPAAVFHKDDLRADSAGETFGPALADALADGRTHVAVVLNAVDDRLAKEQKLGDGAWRAEHVPALLELLDAAAAEGMAVLLTSDHGHVVDRHGAKVDAAEPGSARHRAPGGPPGAAEVALAGPRVVWPETGDSIVALWDADSRYTARKAGYHGGASLAEFCIPVLAFLPFNAEPPQGWRELGDPCPAWWSGNGATPGGDGTVASPVRATAAPKPPRERPTRAQEELAQTHDSLFEVTLIPAEDEGRALLAPALTTPHEALVAALLASDAFAGQVGLLARRPPVDKVEKALLALLDAGGTLPVTAVAQRVDYPQGRADGFAAVLRQLLNHDGVQVLEILPDGRTLRLDTRLLRLQFDL